MCIYDDFKKNKILIHIHLFYAQTNKRQAIYTHELQFALHMCSLPVYMLNLNFCLIDDECKYFQP